MNLYGCENPDSPQIKAWELQKAIKRENVSLCRQIVDGLPAKHRVLSYFNSALADAARLKQVEIVRLLLDAGFEPNVVNDMGYTPLHMAQSYGCAEAVDLLLAAGAISSFVPEKAESSYLTPFQSAVVSCREEVVRRYVSEYGEDMSQRTIAGKTLIQLAKDRPQMKALLRSLKSELVVRDVMSQECSPAPAVARRASGMQPI